MGTFKLAGGFKYKFFKWNQAKQPLLLIKQAGPSIPFVMELDSRFYNYVVHNVCVFIYTSTNTFLWMHIFVISLCRLWIEQVCVLVRGPEKKSEEYM